jgi:hypothetical protein
MTGSLSGPRVALPMKAVKVSVRWGISELASKLLSVRAAVQSENSIAMTVAVRKDL